MDVHPGDMLYVAAGTVHTIGGGLVLVETQQSSDVTYRLYDYGRPRELHIEQGLAAIKLNSDTGKVVQRSQDNKHFLVRSPFFQVERMGLQSEFATEMTPASPHIIVAVDGSGVLESAGMEPVSFARGDAVVVPACVPRYTVRPQWELEIMRMSLPAAAVGEPQTVMVSSAAVER